MLFQVCRTSVSWMLCLSACSSRKSNMYLMARGRALPRCTVLNKVSNKSSTNFCRVPWGHVGGATCRMTPISRSALEMNLMLEIGRAHV